MINSAVTKLSFSWVEIKHLGAVLPCLQICPSCSNSNFSWRGECNKCGKARPEGAPVVQQQPGALPAQLPNVPLKPGDWSCSAWLHFLLLLCRRACVYRHLTMGGGALLTLAVWF